MITKLVSGGQAGVDRAALDAALELGIPVGGWCPKNRKAEDGRIPDRYPLTETPSACYAERTRRNVRDSDGTLVLAWGDGLPQAQLSTGESYADRLQLQALDTDDLQTELMKEQLKALEKLIGVLSSPDRQGDRIVVPFR